MLYGGPKWEERNTAVYERDEPPITAPTGCSDYDCIGTVLDNDRGSAFWSVKYVLQPQGSKTEKVSAVPQTN